MRADWSRYVAQILMNELDCDGPFAHTGCHALHRTISHVAHCEDARDVRLEQAGITLQRPASGALTGLQQIRTRKYKPSLIALDCSFQPGGARLRADEDEQRICPHTAYFAGAIAHQ